MTLNMRIPCVSGNCDANLCLESLNSSNEAEFNRNCCISCK